MTGNATGTFKTDLSWLSTFEDSSFYYRLASVELCNVSGVLTGVRASVVKIIASTKKSSSPTQLTRFGNVNQTSSVSCRSLNLSFSNDEYVTSMTVFYSAQIDQISFITNLNQNLTVGIPLSASLNTTTFFEEKDLLLAFQGSVVPN